MSEDSSANDSFSLEYQHERMLNGARDEMSLVSERLNWFLAVQGFLLTSVAISIAHLPYFWFSGIFLPLIGWKISREVQKPLKAALATVTYWLDSLEDFYTAHPEFAKLSLEKQRGRAFHLGSNQFPIDVANFFQKSWLCLAALVLATQLLLVVIG